MSKLPSVLVFVPYYLPGYKSGGPIRTVSSIVESCGEDFDFSLITRDRDSGDSVAYDSVDLNSFNWVGKAKVFYADDQTLTFTGLRKVMASCDFQALYLNSFFHPVFTLKPLLLNALFFRKPVLLCPRGEFSPGALGLKSFKKKLYLNFFKLLRLHKQIVWQATTQEEATLIRSTFDDDIKIKVAQNISLPSLVSQPLPTKQETLKVAFLSRISHKKNLSGALQALGKVSSNVIFDVYGPASRSDDQVYLKECQAFASTLPANIQVNFKGEVRHEQVGETLKNYDLFFLPTLGENFGHAIIEALAAGLPLLIGNTTPWKYLEQQGIGWDIDPADTASFAENIEQVASMPVEQHAAMRQEALQYAKDYLDSSEAVAQTKKMFNEVIQEG